MSTVAPTRMLSIAARSCSPAGSSSAFASSAHGDHPWLASRSTFAAGLTAVTGVAVSWRWTSQAEG